MLVFTDTVNTEGFQVPQYNNNKKTSVSNAALDVALSFPSKF